MLDSYATESSRDVRARYDKIVEVASWMAYEELPMPEFALPFKLAPLGVWMTYATLHAQGKFKLNDADKMTALAD